MVEDGESVQGVGNSVCNWDGQSCFNGKLETAYSLKKERVWLKINVAVAVHQALHIIVEQCWKKAMCVYT